MKTLILSLLSVGMLWNVALSQKLGQQVAKLCVEGDSLALAELLAETANVRQDLPKAYYLGQHAVFFAVKGKCPGCLSELMRYLPKDFLDISVVRKLPLVTYAVQNRHPATLLRLLELGANPDPDLKRPTIHPMFEALSYQRNAGPAMALITAGCHADIVFTKEEQQPLHYAAEMNHVGFITFLLEKGVDVNATDRKGNTPLVYALAAGDNAEAVEVLIAHDADLTVTQRGKTLIDLATKLERTRSLKLLEAAASK